VRAATCVAAWAHAAPRSPAVVCGAVEFDYATLDARVDSVASELRAVGVTGGDRVAVALPLGMDAVVAFLGVLRAGAAFVPLDPGAPVARLEQVLELASAGVVIGSAAGPPLRGPTGCRLVDVADVVGAPAVDGPRFHGSYASDGADDATVDGAAPAYVLFTSGSTSTPKGIRVSHDNLDAYLRHASRSYATAGHGATLATRPTFDLSITCLFLPLLRGERLRVVPEDSGVQALGRTFADHPNLGLLKLTPSHLRLLDQTVPPGALADRVTTLVVGGEALHADDLARWRAESPGTTIVNEYGPTETTVGVTVHDATVDPVAGRVPIGRAVEGVTVTLVDDDGDVVADGAPGEILVAGDLVAGYLGPTSSTAFGVRDGVATYRTGDLGVVVDGVLHYRGRRDDQVKVSGHRVELGEVEAVVRRHPGVADACAVLVPDPRGTGTIVLAAVARGPEADTDGVLTLARAHLPAAAVPSRVEWRAELPTSTHGKTDRAALVAGLTAEHEPVAPHEAPGTLAGPAEETGQLDTDVAVVGFDCVVPGAPDAAAFWSMLVEGRDGLTDLDDQQLLAAGADPADIGRAEYVRRVGVIDDIDRFDAEFFALNPAEARLMDPQHRLLIDATWRALQHAGRASLEDRRDTGIITGVSANTYLYNHLLPHRDQLRLGAAELQLLMGSEKDFAPSRTAYALRLEGPAVAVQSGCSTGLSGVHVAVQSLLAGEATTMVVGAACVRVPHHLGTRYREGSIVSPSGVCRAFDADADGCVQGNGVVTVVLRLLSDAERDGDTVYAVVKGSALGNDGRRKVGYAAPSVGGQYDVLTAARDVAGVASQDIGYVEAHGTGTLLGDPVEAEALDRAFPDRSLGPLLTGSVKTNIGHLDTAAGLVGLLKVVLALHHRTVPPSLGFDTPNPKLPWRAADFQVVTRPTPWPAAMPYAGVSAFSVGGANAHVILAPAPSRPQGRPTTTEPVAVLLSAPTVDDLDTLARQLADHVEAAVDLDVADVAHTLLRGRDRYAHRGSWIAGDRAELVLRLRTERGDRAAASAADPGAPEVRAAELWLAGGEPEYDLGPGRRRVALPRLPMHPRRHWAEVAPAAPETSGLLAPQWREEPLPVTTAAAGRWLVLAYPDSLGAAVVAEAAARGHTVVRAGPGTAYERRAPADVLVPPEVEDFARLLDETGPFDVVVHAWRRASTWPTMRLARALARTRPDRPTHVLVVAEDATDFAGSVPAPSRVTAVGLVLVLPQERADTIATLADVAPSPGDDPAVLARRVVAEAEAATGGVVALRGRRRYRRTLVPLAAEPAVPAALTGGTWLVTGGFGGVGGKIADALADGGNTLVLLERPAPTVETLAAIEEQLGEAYGRRLAEQGPPLLHDDPELVDRLTALAAADADWCLAQLGLDPVEASGREVDELVTTLGTDPALTRLLSFLLAGARTPGTPTDRALARARVVEWAPDLAPLTVFTARCVDAVPEVLTGRRTAVQVLYPAGDPTDMETAARITMARSSGSQQVHVLADWVAQLSVRSQRPLRVLEIGAGNGLLTDIVVTALRRTGTPFEYWATDLGQTFAAKLAARHGTVEGFHTAVVDASRAPGEQGLTDGFDLVLGLNVVHATRDVEAAAAALRTALVPGGYLALLESVKLEPWVDLVAGLAPGWWSFDDAHRTESPLLDVAGWERVLERAGYAGVAVSPRDESSLAVTDCALLLARNPGHDDSRAEARRCRVRELEGRGARVTRVTADLQDPDAVHAAVRDAVKAVGSVHGLVHCAAEFRGGMLATVAEQDQVAELGAKADGAAALLAALAAQPLRQVVLSSSYTVHAGGEGQAAYVAANAALAALAVAHDTDECRTVAVDWGRWSGVGHAARIETAYRTLGRRDLPRGLSVEDALAALGLALASGLPQVAVPDGAAQAAVRPAAVRPAAVRAATLHPASALAPSPRAVGTRTADSGRAAAERPQTRPVDRPAPAAGPGDGRDDHTPDAEVSGRLLALCQALTGQDLGPDDRLSDAGADSIVILELQADIETELGVHVMTPALLGQTVAQLASAIADPGGHPGSVRLLDVPVATPVRPGESR
jgi:amino acid adenylation domain-containing protein